MSIEAERWDYLNRQSEYSWEKIVAKPLGKLKLAEALWARYDTELDQSSLALAEKREWLKGRAGQFVKEADAQAVLDDYHCRRFVLRLWADAGLRRLELRAKETQ